jgi:hypothetical protein
MGKNIMVFLQNADNLGVAASPPALEHPMVIFDEKHSLKSRRARKRTKAVRYSFY